ncbi:MAG: hypothetical protein MI976_10005 [Pseudomonadales bacterium]|nr:hypothetical protein [Pseudomonadales bacterium]
MKLFLAVGILFAVLTLACPHLFSVLPQSSLVDPASAGLLGMGLVALGMARKQQDKKD